MASFQSRLRGIVGNVGVGVGGSAKDKDKDKDKEKDKDHGHGHHAHHKKTKEKENRKSSLTNSSTNLKRGSSLAADDPDNADLDSTASSVAGSQPNLFSAGPSSHHGPAHSHAYATGGFMSNSGSANDLPSSSSHGAADASAHSVPPRAITPASVHDSSSHSHALGSGMAHSSSADVISSSDPHLGSSGAQTPNSESGSLERPSSCLASNSLRNPTAQQQAGSNGKLTSSESNESLPDSSNGKAGGGAKSSKSKLSKWKDKALEKSEKWMVKANELRHGHGAGTKKSMGEVSARVFNVPLHTAVSASQIDETCPLPAVVIRSIEFLEAKGMYEVGLYRIPGSSSTVGRLKNIFDCGGDLNLFLEDPPVDPHAVATLLKLFLRELPENILGSYLPHFTEILTTEPRPIPLMAALARQLPLPNYYLLSWLCAHLARLAYFSDVNKMTIKNLALIFSWTLQLDSHLLTTLVDHAMELFPLTSDGLIPDEVYKGEEGEGGEGAGAGEYSATYHTANTTALGVVGDDGNSTPEMGYSPPQVSAPAATSPGAVAAPLVSPGQVQAYQAVMNALVGASSPPADPVPVSSSKAPPSLPSRPGSPLRAAVTPDPQPMDTQAPQGQRRPASVRSMSPTRSPMMPVHSRSATAPMASVPPAVSSSPASSSPVPAHVHGISPTASPPQLHLLGSLDIGARLSMDFADLTMDPLLMPPTASTTSASSAAAAPLHGYSSSSRESSPSRSMTQPVQGASPKLGRSPSPALPQRSTTSSPRPASPARVPSPVAVDTATATAGKSPLVVGDLLVFESPVEVGPGGEGNAVGQRAATPPPDPFADPSSP